MAKTLFYRLFGVGKLPAPLTAQLEQEGVLLLDEGLPGSATYLNFRAPWRYAAWRRQWYTAAIALTKVRLLGLAGAATIIDVPLTDERLRRVRFSLEKEDQLLVAFDAGLFRDDWSGMIEYRFRTPHAPALVDALRDLVA